MDRGEKAFFITIVGMIVMLIWSLGVFVGLEKMENIKDNKGAIYEVHHSDR